VSAFQKEVCVRLSRLVAFVFALTLVVPAGSSAQDFGVMESAETINPGNFKVMGYPMFVFGQDGAEDDFGVVLRGGYGFTDNFDAEFKLGIFENITFIGGDAEFWLVKNAPLDVSVSGGFHAGTGDDVLDTTGIDLTFLASAPIAERLELYGALDVAFSFVDDDFAEDFTTVHLVPGVEYAISRDLDLVAEFGIGLNDDSWHYFSAGIAYYVR
jgi:hypothetical protein